LKLSGRDLPLSLAGSGMSVMRFMSKIDQVAAHLRNELERGRWGQEMPGRHELAQELGINSKTVEAALQVLLKEGVLLARGAGRRRRVLLPEEMRAPSLRVAVLNYDVLSRGEHYIVDLMHQLRVAGHVPVTPRKTLLELGMKVERVARLVEETPADAWVIAGGSRGVLEWFIQRGLPAFALFGRRQDLTIAGVGPDKPPVMIELTRRLVELGHRRIVLLARAERRLPEPGATERVFLRTLESSGICAGNYHLPAWEENVDGFHHCLEELVRVTPPTAIIIDEAPFLTAALQFFARLGRKVPEDISLACCDSHPTFSWCKPPITHIDWDIRPAVRRITRWAHNVSLGKDDRKQTNTRARLIEGGTIGPVK
jgi:hypothetical protein